LGRKENKLLHHQGILSPQNQSSFSSAQWSGHLGQLGPHNHGPVHPQLSQPEIFISFFAKKSLQGTLNILHKQNLRETELNLYFADTQDALLQLKDKIDLREMPKQETRAKNSAARKA
jgi:hypothetical protein